MIQRIQSVFLLLAAASFGGLLSFPLAISDKPTAQFLADSVYDITDHIALLVLTILGIAISLITIFLFRNRPLQLKRVSSSLCISLPLAAFLLLQMNLQSWTPKSRSMIRYVLPAGAILLGLAIYFIERTTYL
jgi:hypothetical protein